jgi:glucosyl-dolichyl phosphate glucuronosyltransferase
MLPFISIIIPTYNRSDMISITLDSFLAQTYPKEQLEIIVCNNNSNDRTQIILEEYAKKNNNITILFEARQGVHYARNSAAKRARGDILYFTDDDMIADKYLLENLISIFINDASVGTATGKVLPHWEMTPPRWVKENLINSWLSLIDLGDKSFTDKNDFGVYSCHQAIRRDIFFNSGGFNPENTAGIWIGDGETGLNIKIKELGSSFAYIGNAVIHHIIPPTRMTQSYLNKRIGNQGNCDAYTEYRKHRNTKKLFFSIIKQFYQFTRCLIKFLYHTIQLKKDSIRFDIAYLFYFFKKIKYNFNLLNDKKFLQLVEKDDWLKEEHV